MTSKSSKSTKKDQPAPADAATDNTTLASILAELQANHLTKPDSLSVRFENKLASIDASNVFFLEAAGGLAGQRCVIGSLRTQQGSPVS